jgi:hypothetical protein
MRLRAASILPSTYLCISPAATYFLSAATRSGQETPLRCLRPPTAGALRFSPAAGFAHRPSMACGQNRRHPASTGAKHSPAPTPRAVMLGAARRGEPQRRRSKSRERRDALRFSRHKLDAGDFDMVAATPNPWDRPVWPAHYVAPTATPQELYAEVGKALTSWTLVEHCLCMFFQSWFKQKNVKYAMYKLFGASAL